MKAAVRHHYGTPEVLSITDIPRPEPRENEILIRVHAASVNRTDSAFLLGKPMITRLFSGVFKPKVQVLGCEFAGVVEQVGTSVTRFEIGDRVFGYDDILSGAHAEYKCFKENGAIAHIPDNISFESAAIATEGAHYALCDIRAAKVQANHHVLVNGATGAIGSAAVQLLKNTGAHVTAVCSTPHLELVRSLGADEVIDFQQEDFTESTKQFDFIFDAVGKRTFGQCRGVLKEKGIYISTELGPGSQNIFLGLIAPLMPGRKLLFPIPSINRHDVEFLAQLLSTGKFNPLLDKSFTLNDVRKAYDYVLTGMKIGNVSLLINNN